MRKTIMSVAALAALGMLGVLSAAAMAHDAARSSATVSLHKTNLGTVLVSSSGRTLYLFKKDANGKSACSGACAAFWPPLVSHGKATAGTGVKVSLLGTTRRSNGTRQVTYNKHPLYTFKLDKAAGQTNGEGTLAYGAKWYAVSAKGTAVVAATPPVTTTGTTTTVPYPDPYP